jgi:hypothetical protein
VTRSPKLCLLALLLPGCPNPQTYSPPRTLAKGESSHAIALEAYELRSGSDRLRLPGPTYVYRHGLSDELDLGLRAVNMSSLGVDLKYNFLRSDVDLAVNPGAQFAIVGLDNDRSPFLMLDLPLLVGINAAPEVTIVLGGGGAFISGDALDEPETQALDEEALFARGTLGLDLRFTQRFAVHPSVTIFHGLSSGESSVILAGCAFRIGGPAYQGLSF